MPKYICKNARYSTDDSKGFCHGEGQPRGSVFPKALCTNEDGASLWLEYVKDLHGSGGWAGNPLWLMWYDVNGKPTISHSATFDLSHMREILSRFIVESDGGTG
ncbi:hypothetical protein [Sphingobium sp. MK2]|uniref:hypothetical protein n=1 Tax=Sphingobium sp. MK2 TaxID=3116540 RepID=UPI0032E3627E